MNSEPFKSNKLNELIEFYLQTHDILSFEMTLEKLLSIEDKDTIEDLKDSLEKIAKS